ncbi:TIGR04282 family arsenosugar biosynthesis glycosyltransferase [Rhodopirellula halodulae]|uniref:TIGR04282 family arsenosugar biosynthesis glycosyltransferase n=1 Tax=Rhodopirellula halodulae TaxID=2894198 RepID=UPI001E445976|nr:TIGR04282 family arsenosugar biosynthesis glycosyltransferase [Rhodopirellula sp. JC737]MCC9657002.1 TIGR04282 family arsenosugar biosynthesis glycosyltransferase [Rhodopirellula sp. JC737]
MSDPKADSDTPKVDNEPKHPAPQPWTSNGQASPQSSPPVHDVRSNDVSALPCETAAPAPRQSGKPESAQPRPTRVLGVMAKVAMSGKVKTRLGSTIGFDQAACLHQRFLDQLFQEFRDWGERREWVASPVLAARKQQSAGSEHWAGLEHWTVVDQGDGDLGDRMNRWFASQSPRGDFISPTHAILIGADCPLLATGDLNTVTEMLLSHDLVLGPADDGGYYLIAICLKPIARDSLQPTTFRWDALWQGVRWSTETVFEETMRAAESMGLRVGTLPTRSDVDTFDDLTSLLHQIENLNDNTDVVPTRSRDSHRQLASDIRQILKLTVD